MTVKLGIKRITDTATIPKYAHYGDACFDIYSDGIVEIGESWQIHATGLKFDIPDGYAMMVYSRSGMGFNGNTRLANCVGVIDSTYVGEVKVKLTCDASEPPIYRIGDRIAQAMIIPIPGVEIVEVDEIGETARGDGGFGSTGQ